MKLCLVQSDVSWENKSENRRRCRFFIEQAAEKGAQLVVFPELSLTNLLQLFLSGKDVHGQLFIIGQVLAVHFLQDCGIL